ncbi:uncharacterized protein [Panulirus ornatus]|uniref:uncharacterized protein isoform X2 n=1 Tax=Panulirus ornatus TaxID=150431 RepID=UPI003A86D384
MSTIVRALLWAVLVWTLCQASSSDVEAAQDSAEAEPPTTTPPEVNFAVAPFLKTPMASNLVHLITNAMRYRGQDTEDTRNGSTVETTTEEDPLMPPSHAILKKNISITTSSPIAILAMDPSSPPSHTILTQDPSTASSYTVLGGKGPSTVTSHAILAKDPSPTPSHTVLGKDPSTVTTHAILTRDPSLSFLQAFLGRDPSSTTSNAILGKDPTPTTSRIIQEEAEFTAASSDQFGSPGTGSKLMEMLPAISDYSLEVSDIPLSGAGAFALMALGALFAVPVAPAIIRRTTSSGWAGLPSWSDLFGWWSSPEPTAEAWANNYYQRYENDGGEYLSGAYSNGEQYYGYDPSGNTAGLYYTDDHMNQVATATASRKNLHATGYHNTNPPIFHGSNNPTRLASRRQGENRRNSVDGYEYVTLEQINRIGDESIRVLNQMANGYTVDEIYAYRDSNQLNRRRLPPLLRQQYEPEPSYQEAHQHYEQTYMQEEPVELDDDSNSNGHQPHKDTFSLVDSEEEGDVVGDNPYRHKYDFATSASEVAIQKDETQDKVLKVSEFPYEFHKAN